MVTVTSVLRRTSSIPFPDSGSSSGESSRRTSIAETQTSRRPSLANLTLRLSSRSKRSRSAKEMDFCPVSAQKLGAAFFALPDEITVDILCYLSPADILALRRTSRHIYTFLKTHANPITRSVLREIAYERTSDIEDPLSEQKAIYTYNYIQAIYPRPQPCNSMDYLLQMLRRQSQVDRMLIVMSNFIQMKIYMIPSSPRFENFQPYKEKLIKRFHLATWLLTHFLEHYREMLVVDHPNHPSVPSEPDDRDEESSRSCRACVDRVKQILRTYPGTEVIPSYHLYDLSRQHLRTLSRAPSYAGSIERRLRGWSRRPPSDADLMQFVMFGGMPELCKLSMLKGSYNSRIEVIGGFVDKVSSAAVQQRISTVRSSSTSLSESSLKRPRGASSSFEDLTGSLEPPLSLICHNTISAVPEFDRFIVDSEPWLGRMFKLVRPDEQIVSAFGFVQNILAGKGDGRLGSDTGVDSDDRELDFLAPVKGFE